MRWWQRISIAFRISWRKLNRYIPRQLWTLIIIPAILLAIGTFGYPWIEGDPWSYFDGFYMTAITLTTIGYGELYPLSNKGRVFTIVLAYGGIFTLAYFMSELVRTVLSGELQDILGRQRMEEELAKMRKHVIVCGLGRMGRIVCYELERQRRPFVVIDSEEKPGDWKYEYGVHLQGNATEDEILRKAGVERAKSLISALGSDADNLYITLSSRLLNPNLWVVARAEEEEAEVKLRKVGANKIVSPYLTGGIRAVQAVLRPSVLEFMEMANRPEFHDLQMEQIKVEAGSRMAGKSLRELRLNQDYSVIIIGIIRANGDVTYGPQGDVVVEAESTLIGIGRRNALDKVEALANKS